MGDGYDIPDEVYQRSLERLRRMSQADRLQRLKDIGILTAAGNLSARYGGEQQPPHSTARQAMGSADK